jgi:predicted metalloprotease with PDZ domain
VAMLLDDAIRRKSGGTQNLDDVMRMLADEARSRVGGFTTDDLFGIFAGFADDAALQKLRALVDNGGMPDLKGLFAPCLSIEPAGDGNAEPAYRVRVVGTTGDCASL